MFAPRLRSLVPRVRSTAPRVRNTRSRVENGRTTRPMPRTPSPTLRIAGPGDKATRENQERGREGAHDAEQPSGRSRRVAERAGLRDGGFADGKLPSCGRQPDQRLREIPSGFGDFRSYDDYDEYARLRGHRASAG